MGDTTAGGLWFTYWPIDLRNSKSFLRKIAKQVRAITRKQERQAEKAERVKAEQEKAETGE